MMDINQQHLRKPGVWFQINSQSHLYMTRSAFDLWYRSIEYAASPNHAEVVIQRSPLNGHHRQIPFGRFKVRANKSGGFFQTHGQPRRPFPMANCNLVENWKTGAFCELTIYLF
jgi:hypothetical protein